MPVIDHLTPKLKAMTRLIEQLPDIAGQEAVSFFKERFEKQGWQDGSFQPWARKKVDNNYPVLRSRNTNGLVDTIHWQRLSRRSVVIRAGGPGKPYARIHNEGGTITVPVTEKMRKWAWGMYSRTKDPKYKAIALQKKTVMQIKMPKRQYIGASRDLLKRIETVIHHNVKRILS
jgi:phage gpG-like protein